MRSDAGLAENVTLHPDFKHLETFFPGREVSVKELEDGFCELCVDGIRHTCSRELLHQRHSDVGAFLRREFF